MRALGSKPNHRITCPGFQLEAHALKEYEIDERYLDW